mmetsp:Transcript_32189/g.42443  ORF Transcript_32189/g.42443 Transcript_32189/m.42443 type:complete len:250 (+) Transcript_32189:914-1663(+)
MGSIRHGSGSGLSNSIQMSRLFTRIFFSVVFHHSVKHPVQPMLLILRQGIQLQRVRCCHLLRIPTCSCNIGLVLATPGTTSLVGTATVAALNEPDMALSVGTICMGIARCATLVALRKHIICDILTQALIKYVIFAFKFRRHIFSLLRNCLGIVDDSSIQALHIIKSKLLFHISTNFDASYSSSAVHHNWFILWMILKNLVHSIPGLAKVGCIHRQRFVKDTNICFVSVAAVQYHCIIVFKCFVPLHWL